MLFVPVCLLSPGNRETADCRSMVNTLTMRGGHERAEEVMALSTFSTKKSKLVYSKRKRDRVTERKQREKKRDREKKRQRDKERDRHRERETERKKKTEKERDR